MSSWNFSTSATTGNQDLQELQELEVLDRRLLRGIEIIRPQATECIPGTRASILADIGTKIDDRNGVNAIWIRGAPGCGKSSLSLTAKSILQRQGRLIAYFRFDRNQVTTTTPTALWRLVAYGLGRRLSSVRTQLLQELRNDTVDLDSPMSVFTSLIENPLSRITNTVDHPLVVVIDALDECGGLAGHLSPDRQTLLQTLRCWARLPLYFKLLITSRPEGDITRVLSSISTPIDIPSGRSVTENPQVQSSIDSSNDIHIFLEDRFQKIRERFPSLPIDWPGPETTNAMVHRAAGIFMWATTAANSIDSEIDPNEQLRNIMDGPSGSSGMESLYSLYAIVLKMAFGKMDPDGVQAELLRSVLSTMVLAKRPFDDVEYTKLPTTRRITQTTLEGIRYGLRSVIASGSLRFVHKSFDDFLLSEECPPKYAIRKDESQFLLTKLCLKIMTEELRFNICGLETSCLKNADMPDISTKVTNGISPLLSYSCLFFADHLGLTPFNTYLLHEVQNLMLDKLLFWFEAMSLLKEINQVPPSLLLILKWLHISPVDEFKDFLHDAHQFIRAFGIPIAQSAPHIYISALPFAPKGSSVAKRFLLRFPWILALATGKSANWPSCIFTSEHGSVVSCVAFSADGKYFASVSNDDDICVFDSETGNLISGPFSFEGDGWPRSVCFDSDGHRVAAGYSNGKVIYWDIETGNKHLVICTSDNYNHSNHFPCRFVGSQTIVTAGKAMVLWDGESGRCEHYCDWEDEPYVGDSLTSISPDGCYIALVAGPFGRIIRIWKVVNRSKIRGPIDSHPQFEHPGRISVLSFSADSKFVVSGSWDGTILIWDAGTGDTIGPPFSIGAGWVSAVVYSPKNHLLVATNDTVTVWSTTMRELLGQLEGHVLEVTDIVLSPDGQRALTASVDRTVRMWDLGRVVPEADQRNTSAVLAWDVAFSPCGKKLGSLGRGMRQGWDTNTGISLLECNTEQIHQKLLFSPDGSQVVAYGGLCSGGIEVLNANARKLASERNSTDDEELEEEEEEEDDEKEEEEHIVIIHAAFRSTDGMLVLCGEDSVVRIRSVENGIPQVITKLPYIVALSPDGLTAIVHDNQRSPHHYVWSTTAHQPLPLVLADDEHVSGNRITDPTAYSPSGQFFASFSSSGGRRLRVWNMRTGALAACISTTNRVDSLAFLPNDRHIAITCSTLSSRTQVWIFDACTGQLTSGPWGGHTDEVGTLAFSPDGKTLASCSWNSLVRVWNISHMLGDSQPLFSDWGVRAHMEDGWVKDIDGNLLFWVPNDHEAGLVWPHSLPLGDREMMTELDLSKFRYGEHWTECFAGET